VPTAQIIRLFRDTAFDPESVHALCTAYELASKGLHDREHRPPLVNEVIARRIIQPSRGKGTRRRSPAAHYTKLASGRADKTLG
jgi:hypothetical protein